MKNSKKTTAKKVITKKEEKKLYSLTRGTTKYRRI